MNIHVWIIEQTMAMEYSWNSSYVYGTDNVSGWGERYFFTYYSEFDGRPTAFVIVEVTILALIFLISVTANASIVVCVLKFSDMQTVTNCFVLNLAAADLLFAFTIPAVAYTRMLGPWQLGDIACRIVPYIQFVAGIVLLWTLSLISIDRHRCIVIPPYRSKMTSKQVSIYSTITWLLAAVVLIPVAFWFRLVNSVDNKQVCTLIFPKSDNVNYSICFIVPVLVFACLLPMVLLVYHYQRIFQKILSTKNTWATSCVVINAAEVKGCQRTQTRRQSELSISEIFVPWPRRFSIQTPAAHLKARTESLSQHEEIRLNKHIKVVRILFLNVVVVLVMWLPITVVMLLIFIDGRRLTDDRHFFLKSHHFIACLMIAFLNTIVNPLLYGVLSDNFRACLLRIWRWKSVKSLKVNREQVTPSSGRLNGVAKAPKNNNGNNSLTENPNGIV